MLVGSEPELSEELGTRGEFDAARPLPVQFMSMNPAKIPIELPVICAWIVLGVVAGTPGLTSWATAHEAVSNAVIDKTRFINSSVRIVGAELDYMSPALLRQFQFRTAVNDKAELEFVRAKTCLQTAWNCHNVINRKGCRLQLLIEEAISQRKKKIGYPR